MTSTDILLVKKRYIVVWKISDEKKPEHGLGHLVANADTNLQALTQESFFKYNITNCSYELISFTESIGHAAPRYCSRIFSSTSLLEKLAHASLKKV